MHTADSADTQPGADQPLTYTQPQRTAAGALRILVIDTDWNAAEQLAGALYLQGHQVRRARRGAEALVVAEELQPELVLIETGGAIVPGCPTSVLLRCRPWAERLVLIGHTRFGRAGRRHCELLHYEFPDAIDVGQLTTIYGNLLRMRGTTDALPDGATAEPATVQARCRLD